MLKPNLKTLENLYKLLFLSTKDVRKKENNNKRKIIVTRNARENLKF